MPSSTSSSDVSGSEAAIAGAFVPMRLTASDRPGVAQPVPIRDIPARPWGAVMAGSIVIFVVLMLGWEWYWRDFGAAPSYRNSNGEWAMQRRRIDQGEGGKTVLTGASRVLFDVQLPVWERVAGERPIQLAMEGTSPVKVIEDLANDPNFTGRLLIGIAPDIFFTGFNYRGEVVPYFHKESPSQRVGNWLSMHFLEPYFAFYAPDFSLATVFQRQDWPLRPGMSKRTMVRKLAVHDADRNTHMWSKVENDPEYRKLAQDIWAEDFGEPPPGMDTPEKKQKIIDAEIARAVAAVEKLRARGVRVLFVRLPSSGGYYEYEQRELPRAITWDLLLKRTGAPGIHFEDYPELQGYELPEWSHVSASEANRLTEALVPIVLREFWKLENAGDRAAH